MRSTATPASRAIRLAAGSTARADPASGWHTRSMAKTQVDKVREGAASTSSGLAAGTRATDRMDTQAPTRSARRYEATRLVVGAVARLYSRLRVEGLRRLPAGSFVLCFSHPNWADALYVLSSMPRLPRIYFFGPEQEEMRRGVRNRLMRWAGVAIPFRPGNRGLVGAMARARALIGEEESLRLPARDRSIAEREWSCRCGPVLPTSPCARTSR